MSESNLPELTHPSPEDLGLFVVGEVADNATCISDHVEECRACQETLHEFATLNSFAQRPP